MAGLGQDLALVAEEVQHVIQALRGRFEQAAVVQHHHTPLQGNLRNALERRLVVVPDLESMAVHILAPGLDGRATHGVGNCLDVHSFLQLVEGYMERPAFLQE